MLLIVPDLPAFSALPRSFVLSLLEATWCSAETNWRQHSISSYLLGCLFEKLCDLFPSHLDECPGASGKFTNRKHLLNYRRQGAPLLRHVLISLFPPLLLHVIAYHGQDTRTVVVLRYKNLGQGVKDFHTQPWKPHYTLDHHFDSLVSRRRVAQRGVPSMRVPAMCAKIVSILILMGFAFGEHVDEESADLEAGPVLAQTSWVNLDPVQLGGLLRQSDVAARTSPLEVVTTVTSSRADSAQQGTSCAWVPRGPVEFQTHYPRNRYTVACASPHVTWR